MKNDDVPVTTYQPRGSNQRHLRVRQVWGPGGAPFAGLPDASPDASHGLIAGGLQSGEEAAANSNAWWRRLNDQPLMMVKNDQ